jgi:hypothetical protein
LNEDTGGRHSFVGTDLLGKDLPVHYPSNTTFAVQDINKPWPPEYEQSFDLVHQRLTLLFAGAKWKEALSALADMVKPGGWIQLVEGTLSTPNPPDTNPCMHRFLKVAHAIYRSFGAPITLSKDIPIWLEELGFVNVQSHVVPIEWGVSNSDPELGIRGAWTQKTAAKEMVEIVKSKLSRPFALCTTF